MSAFSVVIPWRNRPELARTLTTNAEVFARHRAEVLIVNCGGDPDQLSSILRDQPIADVRQIHLPCGGFNWSLANNIGTAFSSRPYLFFLDADIILISDMLRRACRRLEREHCFVHVRTVRESTPTSDPLLAYLKEIVYVTTLVLHDGRRVFQKTRRGNDGSASGPGLIAVARSHLLEAGGFNSSLVHWGFDDFDLHLRLQRVVGLSVRTTGEVLHLSHARVNRVAGASKREGVRSNITRCAERYREGNYYGTYHEDVRLWRDNVREIPVLSRVVPT